VVLSGLLLFSYIEVFNLILDIHTLYYASVFLMLAFQLLQFYIITRMYGSSMGLYPLRNFSKKILHFFTFEAGLILGGSIFLLGIALSFYAVNMWSQVHYGPLDPSYVFRIIIPAGFCIAVGMQLVVFGFLLHTIKHLQQRSLL
jgi:hypothetical protein